MMFPLVLDLATDPINKISVTSCRVLGFSKQAFYTGRAKSVTIGTGMMLGGACGDNAAMESFFSQLQRTSSTAAAGTPATS